jgi:hypothetical protein
MRRPAAGIGTKIVTATVTAYRSEQERSSAGRFNLREVDRLSQGSAQGPGQPDPVSAGQNSAEITGYSEAPRSEQQQNRL